MKTSTKWIVGLAVTALLVGGGVYGYKTYKKKKSAKSGAGTAKK